jgi:hypothetical protein
MCNTLPPPPPPGSFLQRNFLSQIENLDHLSSLQFLVLSRNRLSALQGVASLPNLLALDVDHNLLRDIATEQLPPNLLYLNCAGNPFDDGVATYMRLFADAELRTIDGVDEDAWLEQVGVALEHTRGGWRLTPGRSKTSLTRKSKSGRHRHPATRPMRATTCSSCGRWMSTRQC